MEGVREVKDPRLKAFLPPQSSRLPPTEVSGMQYVEDNALKRRSGSRKMVKRRRRAHQGASTEPLKETG